MEKWHRALGPGGCEESLREVWQFFLFGLDRSCGTNLSIARRACSASSWWKCSRGSQEAAHIHVFHHQLRATTDNTDGKGFNTSVQPYAMADHSDSSRHAAEEAFLRFYRETQWECKNLQRALRVHQRAVETSPWTHRETTHLAVCDEDLSGCHLTITSLRTCSCQVPG